MKSLMRMHILIYNGCSIFYFNPNNILENFYFRHVYICFNVFIINYMFKMNQWLYNIIIIIRVKIMLLFYFFIIITHTWVYLLLFLFILILCNRNNYSICYYSYIYIFYRKLLKFSSYLNFICVNNQNINFFLNLKI